MVFIFSSSKIIRLNFHKKLKHDQTLCVRLEKSRIDILPVDHLHKKKDIFPESLQKVSPHKEDLVLTLRAISIMYRRPY